MDSETPEQIEAAIRQAIAKELFTEAELLVDRYTNAVGSCLSSASPERVRALASQVGALFDWMNAMAASARERASGELVRLNSVGAYCGRSAGIARDGAKA
jgi:hypothetical protein